MDKKKAAFRRPFPLSSFENVRELNGSVLVFAGNLDSDDRAFERDAGAIEVDAGFGFFQALFGALEIDVGGSAVSARTRT